jgi:hypothetical protein
MKGIGSFETLGSIYQFIVRHSPDDRNLYIYRETLNLALSSDIQVIKAVNICDKNKHPSLII